MRKEYWRCFVCTDIHYGVAPPELCPTCKVLNAYVEISAEEARRFLEPSAAAPAPPDFRTAIESFAAGQVFQVNPDREKVDLLLKGIAENERNHRPKFRPLRLRHKQKSPGRVDKREIWHDEANADLMRGYREALAPKCGNQLRVPTFFNTENKDAVCGEGDYEKLQDRALTQ